MQYAKIKVGTSLLGCESLDLNLLDGKSPISAFVQSLIELTVRLDGSKILVKPRVSAAASSSSVSSAMNC
jgi:hypothetical protein